MDNNVVIERIFLDLDGVMINFTKGACKALNLQYPKQFEFNGEWLYPNAGGPGPFWKAVNGHELWANLETFPWANDILKIVNSYTDNWRFLTKPSYDPGSYSGKYESVRKNFGHINKLWLVNGDKDVVCRGPSDLLIDDKTENCEKWIAAGGTVYQWTEITDDYDPAVVKERLVRLKKLLSE